MARDYVAKMKARQEKSDAVAKLVKGSLAQTGGTARETTNKILADVRNMDDLGKAEALLYKSQQSAQAYADRIVAERIERAADKEKVAYAQSLILQKQADSYYETAKAVEKRAQELTPQAEEQILTQGFKDVGGSSITSAIQQPELSIQPKEDLSSSELYLANFGIFETEAEKTAETIKKINPLWLIAGGLGILALGYGAYKIL